MACASVPTECSLSAVKQGNPKQRKARRVGKENPMNSNETEIQAGDWLARLDRAEPTPADLAAFDRWKAVDPRNAAAYARLAATWQALDRIRAIRPSADEPIDNDYLNGAMQHSRSEPLHCSLPDAPQHAAPDSQDPQQHRSSESMRDFSSYPMMESPRYDSPPSRSHRPLQLSSRLRPWFFTSMAASLTVAISYLWVMHTVA